MAEAVAKATTAAASAATAAAVAAGAATARLPGSETASAWQEPQSWDRPAPRRRVRGVAELQVMPRQQQQQQQQLRQPVRAAAGEAEPGMSWQAGPAAQSAAAQDTAGNADPVRRSSSNSASAVAA